MDLKNGNPDHSSRPAGACLWNCGHKGVVKRSAPIYRADQFEYAFLYQRVTLGRSRNK